MELLTAEAAESRAALAALEESLKALRIEAQAAQERRAEIELELVKKQGDLKYLDETSRKELNLRPRRKWRQRLETTRRSTKPAWRKRSSGIRKFARGSRRWGR